MPICDFVALTYVKPEWLPSISLDIDYKSLLQKEEWTDGIEFLEDVSNWASKYEDQYMRPMKEVHDLGEILMQLLLQSHAKFARPLAYLMALVVMGNRLRRAFG
ncbi:hypothetical protein PC129_g25417 [Phytophthora cactorum]|uniref:Uncharacterized protein n=1 Tax=Phytophthora cactorum TaxID=29920 RepID=A0A8T1GPT4_9STRA|nr:hypothetical protein PC129_g25417 [Phytophthora cactorum]